MRVRNCPVCGEIIPTTNREMVYKRELKKYCSEGCGHINHLLGALRNRKGKVPPEKHIMISKYIISEIFGSILT